MEPLKQYKDLIESGLQKLEIPASPSELYEPIRYMLSLGGKRLRPSLVLMGCDLFGGDINLALPAALGIEVFHNFTLLHDDIMDKAPLRRSHPTVHAKWNSGVAILSGDAMFVKSCQLMMQTEEKHFRAVMDLFLQTALEVCEGQQLDMNYEQAESVSIEEYLRMIRLKTAVLLGCALETGAIIAGASAKEANTIREVGNNLGIAFQLHDDLLDVYGHAEKFGKQPGGDLLSNKKTFLLLTALADADASERKELNHWLNEKNPDPKSKIDAMQQIFSRLNIREKTDQKTNSFFRKAMDLLDQVTIPLAKKESLQQLADALMVREH